MNICSFKQSKILSTEPSYHLKLSRVGKTFRKTAIQTVFYFSQKIVFDISYKLSPKEIICMKCQSLFSGKKKESKISSVSHLLNLP